MTRLRNIEKTKRAIMVWIALLVGLVGLVEGFSFWLERHAAELRAKDYRTYLAGAAKEIDRNSFSSALEQIDEAVRRQPDAPEPYVMAGHIHYGLKNWDRALAAYKNARDRGSRDEGIYLNSVWALIELKKYDEALQFGKKAEAAGIQSPALQRYMAEACVRANRLVDAVPFFEKALAGYPNDLYLLDHLRQSYLAAGDNAKADEIRARIADIEAHIHRSKT